MEEAPLFGFIFSYSSIDYFSHFARGKAFQMVFHYLVFDWELNIHHDLLLYIGEFRYSFWAVPLLIKVPWRH